MKLFRKKKVEKTTETVIPEGEIRDDILGDIQTTGKKKRKVVGSKSAKKNQKKSANSIGASSNISVENGVLMFDTKPAAMGLTWVTVEGGQSAKARAAETIEAYTSGSAAQGGFDRDIKLTTYIDLKENGFFGFGDPEKGHKKGMPSLVTAISNVISGDRWIGVFPINLHADMWWMGSMRNGQVAEDRIIIGRNEAEDALRMDLGAEWTAVFAPDDWEIAGSRPDNLWDVVDLKSARKLQDVDPFRTNLPKFIIALLILGLAFAGYKWYEAQKLKELAELEALRRQAQEQITLTPRDYPYNEIVRPAAFVEACEREIAKAIFVVPGWESQPVSCSFAQGGHGAVTTGWTNAGGRFSMLVSALPRDLPNPVMTRDGRSASWSFPISTDYDNASLSDEPWEERTIEERLRQRFQTYSLDIDIRPTQGNVPEATARPVFNSTDLRVGSSVSLTNFGDMFTDIPALRPEAVIYNVATGGWDLVMKAFHPVIMPEPKNTP